MKAGHDTTRELIETLIMVAGVWVIAIAVTIFAPDILHYLRS